MWEPKEFKLIEDPLKIRQFYVDTELEFEKEYMLKVDSGMIYDIYGRHNNKLERAFKIRPEEYYGKIMLNMKGVQGDVIVQLYKSDGGKSDNGKRKYAVVAEKKINKDELVTFDFLQEGKYKLRAILDKNGNGKWDTGLYLQNRQPEEIIYLPVEINVKQNFDFEQEFDLRKPY